MSVVLLIVLILYTVRKLYLNFDVSNSFVLELNVQCDLLNIGLEGCFVKGNDLSLNVGSGSC